MSKAATLTSKPKAEGLKQASLFAFRKLALKWTTGLAATVILFLAARPALAQGCALCYNTAAAENNRGIAALRHGVLILMLPPVIIFGVLSFFTLRGRNRFNDETDV